MKKTILALAGTALLASFSFIGCSGGGDNPVYYPTVNTGITVPPEDMAKTDTQLVSEANTALTNGEYKTAVDKFRSAYAKNPSDANKIYYALTELAALSVDETVVDIVRNKIGMTSYPAEMNALLNPAWAKDKKQPLIGSGWSKSYPRYVSYSLPKITQADDGNFIRVSGTRTNTYSSETRSPYYVLDNGDWWFFPTLATYKKDYTYFSIYLNNVTPDPNGQYIVLYDSTKDASVPAAYRYKLTEFYTKGFPGDPVQLPELAVPSWVTSLDSYKSTLIGSTLTFETWGYLLYANIITNNENGFNDIIDKLLLTVHKKSEAIKSIVDTIGIGTATLEPSFIASLNLKEFFGDDGFTISKTEMNFLVSALEGIDAVLNFVASYDLSGNLKAAETDSAAKQNTLKTIRNCVTSKTLASRDPTKLAAAKLLLSDALGRAISSYNDIKISTTYPQVIKDNIAKYGNFFYDGAVKAKAAIENGSVFYIPKALEGSTFPTDLSSAAFGVDMGKIFTPGYFTNYFERSADLSTIKFYYKRIERTMTTSSTTSSSGTTITFMNQNVTEGELTEITDIDTFFNTTISDVRPLSMSYDGSSYTFTPGISYRVGILANQSVLSAALLGGIENVAEKIKFMDFIHIN